MSRSLRFWLFAVSAIVSLGAFKPALAATAICPLGEVKAGQRAVGKSVFKGSKIESFDIEIIGVLHKFDGSRSVILGKILSGPVVQRESGVLGGMSGSPVYINGRLAGAVAYAWSFSKEPITGITPIEEMLRAWEAEPAGKGRPDPQASVAAPAGIVAGGQAISRVQISSTPPERPDLPGTMTLTPLSGFLQVSGFNPRAVQRLSESLSGFGLQVIQGPGGVHTDASPPLKPGAVVGAQLLSGDLDMSALGTVTVVDGKRVLAFGHPLLQLGKIDVPMTGGYVYDIMPSIQISSKIMAPTKAVGRIYRDHQAAIAGRIGDEADMLPVAIQVLDADTQRARTYSVKVARIKELTPMLIATTVMTAVDEVRGRVSRGTAKVWLEIEAEGRPTMTWEERGYSDTDAAAVALPILLQPIVTLTDNPLGELRMTRVTVRVEAMGERHTASLERLQVNQSRLMAGDQVVLTATLRPHGQEPVDMPITLTLPPDLPQGRVRVVVTGGQEAESARGALGAPPPRPASLDQLVDRLLSRNPGSDLVTQAALTRRAASLRGVELPDLPDTALAAIRATQPSDLRQTASLLKVVLPTEWVISGRQMLTLQVESRTGRGKPPRMGPPGPPEAGEEEPDESEPDSDFGGMPMWQDTAAIALAATSAPAAKDKKPVTPAKPAQKKDKEAEEKPLTRSPERWVHDTMGDYQEAELEGVAVREDGRLTLAPSKRELTALPADVIWAVAVREESAFVGTGVRGMIYGVSPEGQVSEFCDTGEMNVHALAFDEKGALLAATSPLGKLLRITPDGKKSLLADTDSTYLWCLSVGSGGRIYAGGGAPARVYDISPDGEVKTLAELPAANVLSLAIADTALYAGTADGGVVYRVSTVDGAAEAVCQVSGKSVEALAKDSKGNIYAAGSPGGDIYRIPVEGMARRYCKTGQRMVYGLVCTPEDDLVVATGPDGIVIQVGPEAKPEVVYRPEHGTATAIAADQGAVYVGSSGPSALRQFGPGYAASGQLQSAPMDAGRAARWGRIEWSAEVPEGTSIEAETRSGDSPDPEDHWSGWTPCHDGVVASPSARYLQYRLKLTSKDPKVTPLLHAVQLSLLPTNLAPQCAVKEPATGAWIAKKSKLKWEGRDPDKDTLTYEVAVSKDLGKTWKQLKKDLTETSYEWDTAKSEDGRYLLRVTASDSTSRPDDPQTAEALSVVGVDNAEPKVMIYRTSVSVGDDRRAAFRGMATDATSPLRSLEYRVDTGKWRSVSMPMVESSLGDFTVATDLLESGERVLEVRAFDAAGNHASDQVEVKVAEKPKSEETAAKEAEGEKAEQTDAAEAADQEPEEAEAEETAGDGSSEEAETGEGAVDEEAAELDAEEGAEAQPDDLE